MNYSPLTQRLLDLTEDLIKIPSSDKNPDAVREIVDFCIERLKLPGVVIKEYEFNGFPSFVATFEETLKPHCLLVGHLDVVPAPDEDFVPKIGEDGRLYARGAGDMKSAVAIMIELFRYFAGQDEKPSIGLMLTTDEEEAGGAFGVEKLVEEVGYRCEVAMVPDSGSGLNEVIVNQKGFFRFRVPSFGKGAHASRPFHGENAIEKLIRMHGPLREIIPDLDEDRWEPSLNFGKIVGGSQTNQVADYAEMFIDVRFIDDGQDEDFLHKIKEVTGEDIEVFVQGPPFSIDLENEYLKQYVNVVEEVSGKKVKYGREEGASDARCICAKGIPVIVSGIAKGNAHGANEWCQIDEFEPFYEIMKGFVEKTVPKLKFDICII